MLISALIVRLPAQYTVNHQGRAPQLNQHGADQATLFWCRLSLLGKKQQLFTWRAGMSTRKRAATETKASLGQVWNQSKDVQLTRAGN